MKKIFTLIMWAGILLPAFKSKAQIWLGAVPTYYNPSFAGAAEQPRLTSYSHLQNIYGSRQHQQILAFDQFISKIASGIGVNLGYNNYNTSISTGRYLSSEFIISPKISLGGKWTIAPSVSAKFMLRETSIFERYYQFHNEFPDPGSTNHQFGAGILLNNEKFYIGYASYYIPDLIYGGAYFKSPWRHFIQAGYCFQRGDEADFSFTPQLLWSNRYNNRFEVFQSALNLNFRYKKALFGLGQDNMYGIGIIAGFQTERFKVIVLDHTLISTIFSRGVPNSYSGVQDYNSTHISIRYLFNKPNKTP
ncbi:MAG: type IX secretion system membrane protein PorP/SprF [Cytophagaceae bacterium]